MPALVLVKSPGNSTPQRTYPLTTDQVVIGRDESCDVVVPNHAVSRRHAQLIKSNGQYVLHDLNSRNRTYLNGKEVSGPQPLHHDDRIKICDFQFVVQDEKAAARPPLPKGFGGFPPPDEPDPSDPPASSVDNIEHTLSTRSATELLESQPSEKLRALFDISVALSKTLDLEQVFETIVTQMFQVFRQSDRCFLILVDGERLIQKVTKARKAVAPGDDHRFSKTIVRKCLATQQAVVSDDASNDAGLGAAQSIVEFRIRSVMCVPLIAEEKPIGAIQIDTQDRGKKFKEDDLKLLTIIANLCAVAIDKARLHLSELDRAKQQNEIELAREVQRGFLPQHPPAVAAYEFFGFYSAAQTIGGDYYDYIPLQDGRLAVVLGDVAGKGVPASLLMAKLSAEVRYCMLTQPDPAKAIMQLNDNLIRGGIGHRYVTLVALVLDPVGHTVTVVNAGHMYPLRFVARTGGLTDAVATDDTGFPVGLVPGTEYTMVQFELAVGEHLLVFTDGVTDAMAPSGDMFGNEGIVLAMAGPPDPVVKPKSLGEKLVAAVRKHANGRPQNDDIAVVCFGRLVPGANDTGAPSFPVHLKGT